jgi:hypothetical protein
MIYTTHCREDVDGRDKPGHDDRGAGVRHRPCSRRRGVRRRPPRRRGGRLLSPAINARGMERRAAQPLSFCAALSYENAGAFRRSTRTSSRRPGLFAAISVPGAVASGRGREGNPCPYPAGFRPPSSAPRPAHWRAVPRSGDGRRPRASRVRGCEPRPRAPRLPHFKKASRSAPRRTGEENPAGGFWQNYDFIPTFGMGRFARAAPPASSAIHPIHERK